MLSYNAGPWAAALHTFSGDFGVAFGAMVGGATPGSATYPASGTAIYVPFTVRQPAQVQLLFSVNGGTVSGNIDVGVYTNDGSLIVSSGSQLQSGTNATQLLKYPLSLNLGLGRYYWAVSMNTIVGTLFRTNTNVEILRALGVAMQTNAFPLPNTATFMASTLSYLPMVGAEIVQAFLL